MQGSLHCNFVSYIDNIIQKNSPLRQQATTYRQASCIACKEWNIYISSDTNTSLTSMSYNLPHKYLHMSCISLDFVKPLPQDLKSCWVSMETNHFFCNKCDWYWAKLNTKNRKCEQNNLADTESHSLFLYFVVLHVYERWDISIICLFERPGDGKSNTWVTSVTYPTTEFWIFFLLLMTNYIKRWGKWKK